MNQELAFTHKYLSGKIPSIYEDLFCL